MSKLEEISFAYLKENEIIELYELFFGKILIKKNNFSYNKSLSKYLSNYTIIKNILDRLTSEELMILKLLSTQMSTPYQFINEKIQLITNLPQIIINKSLANLFEKKYIFLRENTTIITPDFYFQKALTPFEYSVIDNQISDNPYSAKFLVDLNNLLNFLISKDIKPSVSLLLHKKEMEILHHTFTNYSSLKEVDFNIIFYFYSIAFIENNDIKTESLKKYFSLSSIDKILYFIKIVFPAIYNILNYFYNQKLSVLFHKEDFQKLFISSYISTEYTYKPIKTSFDEILVLLIKCDLIKLQQKTELFLPLYNTSPNESREQDQVKLSSNFNFYINADSVRKEFYMPALFADFQKYNKIVEYEITESSIKRCILHNVSYENITNYFDDLNIQLTNNVATTIKLWFDKYESYYYASGTIFFCKNSDKGRVINNLIENDFIKAYPLKENEIFLIPEEDKDNFFYFLNKSGIHYYEKHPIYKTIQYKQTIFDISHLLKTKELTSKIN